MRENRTRLLDYLGEVIFLNTLYYVHLYISVRMRYRKKTERRFKEMKYIRIAGVREGDNRNAIQSTASRRLP